MGLLIKVLTLGQILTKEIKFDCRFLVVVGVSWMNDSTNQAFSEIILAKDIL